MTNPRVNIVIAATDQTAPAARQARSNLQGLEASATAASRALALIGPVAAAALGGVSLRGIVDTNQRVQTLQASLITFTGSAEAAREKFEELERFASATPYALEEVVGGFNKLVARGINPTLESFEAFGNIAAGSGKSLDQFVEAVADAATGEMERLKEFGIVASKEGDKFKMTFAGVTTVVRNDSAEILRYLERLGREKFGDAMKRQADTLSGVFSNFGDAVSKTATIIGESGLNDWIVGTTRSLTGLIDRFNQGAKAGLGFASAIEFAVRNPTYLTRAAEIRKEIAMLRDLQAGDVHSGGQAGVMSAESRRIELLEKELKLLLGIRENNYRGNGFEDPRIVKGPADPPPGEDDKAKGLNEAQRYLEILQKQGERLQNLTATQQALKDIEAKRLDGLTPKLREQILAQARSNDEAEQAAFIQEQLRAAEQRRADALIALEASTPTARLEQQRDLLQQIADKYQAGEYGIVGSTEAMWRFNEVAQTALGTLPEQWEKATDGLSTFAEQAARNIQDSLGSSIAATLKGDFDSIGDMWKNLLADMAAQAIAAQIGQSLFGNFGTTGVMGGLVGALFSANGNAFDRSGLVSYFADGGVVSRATAFQYGGGRLGVMGEAGPEGILPLKRGRDGKLGVIAQGSQSPVVIHQTMHFGSDVSRAELAAWGQSVKNQTLAAVHRGRTRDGGFA